MKIAPYNLQARPWAPLTDSEYAVLAAWVPAAAPGRRGRPVANLRRTLDAIFWIACSKEPWRALPEHLGKPDSASRTLRRWARLGVLEGLLLGVSRSRHAGGCAVLRGMAYWIARAFRRMARVLPLSCLVAAKRLGLRDAWPTPYLWLPAPNLSETARGLLSGAQNSSRTPDPPVLRTALRLAGAAQRFLRRVQRFKQGWTTK
jgi:transposase